MRGRSPGLAAAILVVLGVNPWPGGDLLGVGAPLAPAPTVQFNELQSANRSTLFDEDGDSSDWLELSNPGPAAFDLGGCGLSDAWGEPFRWVFRTNTVLSPGGLLVVFASGKDRQPEMAPPLPPAGIPGLQVWLRAESVDPLNASQVRTANPIAFLRQWRDQSGHGNHATQAADANQPRWLAAGPGGFPAVRFDGVNDLLRLPRPIATNDFCLFVVCRTSQAHEIDPESNGSASGVSGQRWLFGVTHGGDWDAGAGVSVGTNGISVYEHGSNYMPPLAVYERPIGSELQVIGVNYAARQPTVDNQGLTVHVGLTSPRRQVWAPTEIGCGAYGAFGGDVFEILLFNRPLTVDERHALGRHLADRYRVPLALPLHTNFRLRASGEQLRLTAPDGTVLDQVAFGGVPRDVSFGRAPDDPGQWLFFATPTPGAPNTTPGSTEWLFPPVFSRPGGFHSNAFELSLSVTNLAAGIHYTLDGSEPTDDSPLYTRPILIQSRTGTPNDLSAIPTVPGGQPPSAEVFKGWVVRARAYKVGALPSQIVTRSFWVHPRGQARYTVPVVSLATDRQNFFDPNSGIYVFGNAPGGNYSQRGSGWERPVHVELYEPDGLPAFAQDGTVKIHGNTSQNFPIKGLDLDGTGGAGRQPFRYPIFPDRKRTQFEHFLLRPSGHDFSMGFMRDELMHSLAAETGAETQAARACVVFLNGEYWGLHYLKEKEDTEFVGFYGDVPEDSLDYLEGYAAAKTGDTLHYSAMLQFLAQNDPALPANYAQVLGLMDAPNYIDYKVCEIFNYRWDIGNHRLWRPRTPEGRWRWLQFDNDVGWGGFWAEQPGWAYDMLAADLTPDGRLHDHNGEVTTFLLRRLMLNDSFRRDFLSRFADLLNGLFRPEHTVARVNELARVLAPEMAEHCQRWRAPASLADWQAAVEYLRTYARLRPDSCRQHLIRWFQLPGTVRVTVEVFTTGGDVVRLNTLPVLDADGNGWTGLYFQGLRLPVRAEPVPGHRFVRWLGPVEGVGPQTSVTPRADLTLSAVFTSQPPLAPRVEQVHLLPGDQLEIRGDAEPLQTVAVETSTDLVQWGETRWMVTPTDGTAVFTLPRAALPRQQFYRLRLP